MHVTVCAEEYDNNQGIITKVSKYHLPPISWTSLGQLGTRSKYRLQIKQWVFFLNEDHFNNDSVDDED